VEGGGWRVEGGGWRVEGGGWRVEGRGGDPQVIIISKTVFGAVQIYSKFGNFNVLGVPRKFLINLA
jgi:hypothetical protein